MAQIKGPMMIAVENRESPNYNELEIGEIFPCKYHLSSSSKKNIWEVNLALTQGKLYLINNLNEMIAQMVMDISFAEYSEHIPPDTITKEEKKRVSSPS